MEDFFAMAFLRDREINNTYRYYGKKIDFKKFQDLGLVGQTKGTFWWYILTFKGQVLLAAHEYDNGINSD